MYLEFGHPLLGEIHKTTFYLWSDSWPQPCEALAKDILSASSSGFSICHLPFGNKFFVGNRFFHFLSRQGFQVDSGSKHLKSFLLKTFLPIHTYLRQPVSIQFYSSLQTNIPSYFDIADSHSRYQMDKLNLSKLLKSFLLKKSQGLTEGLSYRKCPQTHSRSLSSTFTPRLQVLQIPFTLCHVLSINICALLMATTSEITAPTANAF